MKNGSYYKKKDILPRMQGLDSNQSLTNINSGKDIKNINSNLIYDQRASQNHINDLTPNNTRFSERIIPAQNTQDFNQTNNYQNIPNAYSNCNNLRTEEESKLYNSMGLNEGNGLVKNNIFTNYINNLILNNQKQNQINNNILLYTPPNFVNVYKAPLNNNILLIPNVNQQYILKQSTRPLMLIQQPNNQIKKLSIKNGNNNSNKYIIKKNIKEQQRYSTIGTDNTNDFRETPLKIRKSKDNYFMNNNQVIYNNEINSYINNNQKRINHPGMNSIKINPPKAKNNIYIQPQTLLVNNNLQKNYQFEYPNNKTIEATTSIRPTIISNQKYTNKMQIKNKYQNTNLTNDFENYLINEQNNSFLTQTSSPIKTPKTKENLKNISEFPEENYNYAQTTINFAPKIVKNLFPQGISLKSCSHLSRGGKEEDGIPKKNQDSYIALTNINNIKDFHLFAVLDGHGENGHLVSKYASQFMLKNIIYHQSIKNLKDPELIYLNLNKNNFQIIKQAFLSTDQQLKNCNFDINHSGTTCILIIILGYHLICANVGDSRGIVVYDEKNDPNLNNLKVSQLSIDYKLEIPEERNRILMAGGSVEKCKNLMGAESGPLRVFSPGEDYPGLAMSRSIGDNIAKKLGVIAEPGIIEYNIKEKTKFIILGSDGIWEFLDNETVKNIGKQYYLNSNSNELCEELYSNALIQWKCHDSIVDDITCIVIYF